MPDHDGRRLDLRSLLAAVEVAPPVAAVDVFAAELGTRLGAEEVSFLISAFNGSALVRLSQHKGGGGERRSRGADAAETVPLAGTPYEHVIRTQRLQVRPAAEGALVLAPVTDRGDWCCRWALLTGVPASSEALPGGPRPRRRLRSPAAALERDRRGPGWLWPSRDGIV